jgi:hypothetical protein
VEKVEKVDPLIRHFELFVPLSILASFRSTLIRP